MCNLICISVAIMLKLFASCVVASHAYGPTVGRADLGLGVALSMNCFLEAVLVASALFNGGLLQKTRNNINNVALKLYIFQNIFVLTKTRKSSKITATNVHPK